jgi:hypothetical protein
MQLKETGWKDVNWMPMAKDRYMVMNPGIT